MRKGVQAGDGAWLRRFFHSLRLRLSDYESVRKLPSSPVHDTVIGFPITPALSVWAVPDPRAVRVGAL